MRRWLILAGGVLVLATVVACSEEPDEVARLEDRIAALEEDLAEARGQDTVEQTTTLTPSPTTTRPIPPTTEILQGDEVVYRLNLEPGQTELRLLLTRGTWVEPESDAMNLYKRECTAEAGPRVGSNVDVYDGLGGLLAVGAFTGGYLMQPIDGFGGGPSGDLLCGLTLRIVLPTDDAAVTAEISGRSINLSTREDWHWQHWWDDSELDEDARLSTDDFFWSKVRPSG